MLICSRGSFAADAECVKAILRRWDPIGVFPELDCCPARGEYDAYTPHLLSMLCHDAAVEEITTELHRIRIESLGLSANLAADAECAARLVALRAEGNDFVRRGYQVAPAVLSPHECDEVIAALPGLMPRAGGQRNVLDVPAVADLIRSPGIRRILGALGASDSVAVSAKLFDKTPQANWKVPWHQDRMLPVADRIDAPGFAHWSVKGGVLYVTPPSRVLEQVLALRVHLDDAAAANSPLRVIPGTHRLGLLREDEIRAISSGHSAAEIPASKGDVVLLRPLLLHASGSSESPANRRVLHIEFAPLNAIAPAKWASIVVSAAG